MEWFSKEYLQRKYMIYNLFICLKNRFMNYIICFTFYIYISFIYWVRVCVPVEDNIDFMIIFYR